LVIAHTPQSRVKLVVQRFDTLRAQKVMQHPTAREGRHFRPAGFGEDLVQDHGAQAEFAESREGDLLSQQFPEVVGHSFPAARRFVPLFQADNLYQRS
jgi:hypothetical protein